MLTGIITTIAGSGSGGYSGDGSAATSATLNNPQGVAVDASGRGVPRHLPLLYSFIHALQGTFTSLSMVITASVKLQCRLAQSPQLQALVPTAIVAIMARLHRLP